jgi:hypothetical protein
MSINYCTLGAATVDGFCGTQRAKVLAHLIHQAGHDVVVPPAPQPTHGGSGGSSYGPGFRQQINQPQYRRPPELDRNIEAPPREQPYITVSAEFMGITGSQTIEVTQRLDFVTITDLEVNHDASITVNISEMQMSNTEDLIMVNVSGMEF